MKRILLAMPALGLLAACAAEPVWTKAGVSATDLQIDQQQCLRSARAQAERERYRSGGRLESPVVDVDASGRVKEAFKGQRSGGALDEQARRNQLFGECMYVRGYRLQMPQA